MQPIIVDRTAIQAVISDMLTTYHDGDNPIFVAWDVGNIGLGDGADYTRNEAGGGRVILSVRNVQMIGAEREDFDKTDGNEGTNHTMTAKCTLSVKIESDVYVERDLAVDIAATISSRSFWPAWRERWYQAGLSVLKQLSLVNAQTTWEGRPMTFATLELDCLLAITERDDDPNSKYFATSAEVTFVNG